MIPTSITDRAAPGGRLPGRVRRHRGLVRRLALAWRLLMRKTRRGPPDSEHLRRDLGLLPIDRPWGPWDFL